MRTGKSTPIALTVGEPYARPGRVAGDEGARGGGEQRLVASDAVGADVEGDRLEPVVVDAEGLLPEPGIRSSRTST